MNIFEYVRTQQTHYETDKVVVAGKEYNQKDRIEQAEITAMCMYKDSDEDALLGRLVYDDIISDKAAKEAQILDFDTKHLDISPKKPTEAARYKAMIATRGVQEQMEREQYGKFFNQWAHTYTKYGGVLSKNVDGKPEVISWHNVITDQTDIMSGVIIEKHYYTPSELVSMEGVWQNTTEALLLAEEDKESEANATSGRKSDTQGHYIEVHEIHGELPLSVLEENGDPTKFRRVFMVVAGVNRATGEGSDTEGIILFETEEKESPYKYLARNPIDGIALGRGMFEELLPQQTIHNFLVNEELKMVAISNKIYVKTNKAEMPQSVAHLDQLSVMKLNDDEYFELESRTAASLPGLRDLRMHVMDQARSLPGMHEAIMGEEGKANEPFALARMKNIEGHSRFRPKRQDIGFHFEEIVRDWTMPKALKTLKSQDELFLTFDDAQLLQIDQIIMNKEMNRKFIEMTLEGEVVTPEDMLVMQEEMQRDLMRNGKRRFIEGLNTFLKDIDRDVRVSFTNEAVDKGELYDSRVAFVQLLGPEHPWSQAMIRKSMDEAGITPEELEVEEQRAAQMGGSGSARGVDIPGNEDVAPGQQ